MISKDKIGQETWYDYFNDHPQSEWRPATIDARAAYEAADGESAGAYVTYVALDAEAKATPAKTRLRAKADIRAACAWAAYEAIALVSAAAYGVWLEARDA
mgnify:CR=1 FL=1|tara:strand:- start:5317 stop:5619 length:303 start_codon:yes stop_codon:yes gene_type:complete